MDRRATALLEAGRRTLCRLVGNGSVMAGACAALRHSSRPSRLDHQPIGCPLRRFSARLRSGQCLLAERHWAHATRQCPAKRSFESCLESPRALIRATALINALAMNKRTLALDSVMTLHQEATSQPTAGYQSAIYRIEAQQKQSILMALKLWG